MSQTIRYQPDSARRVLVVANPAAGSGARHSAISELCDRLIAEGCTAELTSDLQHVERLGSNPRQAELRAVVAAGGDGTVAAVVNRTHPDTPIAVLPLGTENLLARYLQMLVTPQELSHAIVHGATVRLDAGQAADRLFLLMAGCGFDADVVRRLHTARQGHIRHLSYVKPILDAIRTYKYPALRVHCQLTSDPDNQQLTETRKPEWTFVARWLFVVNLPRYACGLRLVPQAIGTDGLLDVCGFERGSLISGFRYLSGVMGGRHLAWPDCHYVQATRVRIESEEEVPYQLDGDPGGTLPVDITVLPARVSLIVSESWALLRGFRHDGGNAASPEAGTP